MKRSLSVIMIITIVCSVALYAHAVEKRFDISAYTNSDAYDIDISTDSGVAFIETVISTSALSFSHKYDSQYMYSSIRSDILVRDYFSSDRYPVVRTWIYYCADKPQYIHSISFEFEDKRYTFTDVGDKDRITQSDNGYIESLLIKYGRDNTEFFSKILSSAMIYAFSKYSNLNYSRTHMNTKKTC